MRARPHVLLDGAALSPSVIRPRGRVSGSEVASVPTQRSGREDDPNPAGAVPQWLQAHATWPPAGGPAGASMMPPYDVGRAETQAERATGRGS
jgi:hypothetical protein